MIVVVVLLAVACAGLLIDNLRLRDALAAVAARLDALDTTVAGKEAGGAAAIAAAPLAEFRANLATWFVVHILGG